MDSGELTILPPSSSHGIRNSNVTFLWLYAEACRAKNWRIYFFFPCPSAGCMVWFLLSQIWSAYFSNTPMLDRRKRCATRRRSCFATSRMRYLLVGWNVRNKLGNFRDQFKPALGRNSLLHVSSPATVQDLGWECRSSLLSSRFLVFGYGCF